MTIGLHAAAIATYVTHSQPLPGAGSSLSIVRTFLSINGPKFETPGCWNIRSGYASLCSSKAAACNVSLFFYSSFGIGRKIRKKRQQCKRFDRFPPCCTRQPPLQVPGLPVHPGPVVAHGERAQDAVRVLLAFGGFAGLFYCAKKNIAIFPTFLLCLLNVSANLSKFEIAFGRLLAVVKEGCKIAEDVSRALLFGKTYSGFFCLFRYSLKPRPPYLPFWPPLRPRCLPNV